jgi:hypothetical protein
MPVSICRQTLASSFYRFAGLALASSLCVTGGIARAEPPATKPSNTSSSNTTPSNTTPSNTTPSNTTPSNTTPSNTTPSNTSSSSAHEDSRPAVEGERKQAEAKAQSSIDQEATTAIRETQNALAAIAKKDKKEALAALERATGKVNILLARNEKAALIPVDFAVEIADVAPIDTKAINDMANAADEAVKGKRFAEARALLDGLRSEIRVRTFTLPLASYPAALTRAAKLMEQDKTDDAAAVLRNALNTLVIVDLATPISLPVMVESIRLADESARKKNIAEATKQLGVATTAVRRADALGQLDQKTAKELQNQLAEIERKVKRNEPAQAEFGKLLSRVESTLKPEKHPQTASRSKTGT